MTNTQLTKNRIYSEPITYNGTELRAWVSVRPHRTTSCLFWDVGSIDYREETTILFSRTAEALGSLDTIVGYYDRHKHAMSSRAYLNGSIRWGCCRFFNRDLEHEFRDLVLNEYNKIILEMRQKLGAPITT